MSGRLRVVFVAVALAGCGEPARLPVEAGMGPEPTLPPPQNEPLPVVNVAPAVGWKSGEAPTPAAGIEVKIFAAQLDHPRWLYVLPNGDVLVAESNKQPDSDGPKGIKSWVMKKMQEKAGAGVPSADRITLLRDGDGDGAVEVRTVFLEDLRSPFGMALIGEQFYVANTDAVVRFQYTPDATRLDGPGETVVELPAGPINRHWTRNLSADPDGRWLYVTVGSNSNIGENGMDTEVGRAAVWRLDPRTGAHHIYASGLRNPNGLAWVPATGHLWTVVNERDEIGGDLVPDYMTAIEEGDFYGWPYSYFGDHVDERVKPQRPDLVAQAKVPDYALGAHTASLGLAYSDGNALPSAFHGGMFIGQHGSWNREPRSGYKVIFVPFAAGEPDVMPRDVLTGFLAPDGSARGRPVGVAFDRHGALLVADDVGNIVWRLTAAGADPGPGRRPETPERATEEEPNAR